VRLAGVLEDGDVMSPGDFKNRSHRCSLTVKMDGDDRLGSWSDGPLQQRRIHCAGLFLDIDKHGACAGKRDGLGGGHKGHRNGNDFISGSDSKRQEHQPDGVSSIPYANGALHIAVAREFLLKFGDKRPAGKSTLVDHLGDGVQEFLTVGLVMRFQIEERYLHNFYRTRGSP